MNKIIGLLCLLLCPSIGYAQSPTVSFPIEIQQKIKKGIPIIDQNNKPILTFYYTEVVDGDTVKGYLEHLPSTLNHVSIRVKGIDTPEMPQHAKCEKEGQLALKAKAFTNDYMEHHKQLIITETEWDKYGGRIVGNIKSNDNNSLTDELIKAGFGKAYKGKGSKPNWCKN